MWKERKILNLESGFTLNNHTAISNKKSFRLVSPYLDLSDVSNHNTSPTCLTFTHRKPQPPVRSLTRFTQAAVALPDVRTVTVSRARWRDAGVGDITTSLHFDCPGWAGEGGGVGPHTQSNPLSAETQAYVKET